MRFLFHYTHLISSNGVAAFLTQKKLRKFHKKPHTIVRSFDVYINTLLINESLPEGDGLYVCPFYNSKNVYDQFYYVCPFYLFENLFVNDDFYYVRPVY